MNRQTQCVSSYLPWFSTSFLEYKYEIPYVKHNVLGGPFMYKPIIYEDTWVDVLGSKLTYGLNTHKSDAHEMTDDSYFVEYEGATLNAIFKSNSSYSSYSPHVAAFQSINSFPWFCKKVLGSLSCASDQYSWELIQIRPVTTSLSITSNFLPSVNGQTWNFDLPIRFLGTSQLVVRLNISDPYSCNT
eukprot:TRINITY_DN3727_c0_g1_i11.p1 TRINITY_DN3727_c0_g1~~TRINITY_DN3727_c0_g1_i11.p1  ORF type:complete len:187 (-),score=22.17 TRINITY_DN3727_c0_g1_i11:112-672(-)